MSGSGAWLGGSDPRGADAPRLRPIAPSRGLRDLPGQTLRWGLALPEERLSLYPRDHPVQLDQPAADGSLSPRRGTSPYPGRDLDAGVPEVETPERPKPGHGLQKSQAGPLVQRSRIGKRSAGPSRSGLR